MQNGGENATRLPFDIVPLVIEQCTWTCRCDDPPSTKQLAHSPHESSTDQYPLYGTPCRPKTLLACSLVCRDWLKPSQRCLYRRIKITSDESLDALAETLRASPRLVGYITSLELGPDLWPDDFVRLPRLASVAEITLASPLVDPDDADIELAYIEEGMVNIICANIERGVRQVLPSITSLHIDTKCILHCQADEVFRLLHCFPLLREVTVEALGFDADNGSVIESLESPDMSRNPPFCELLSLTIICRGEKGWADIATLYCARQHGRQWLDVKNLAHLHFTWDNVPDDLGHVGAMIYNIGAPLTTLTLEFLTVWADTMLPTIDLSRSTGLIAITVCVNAVLAAIPAIQTAFTLTRHVTAPCPASVRVCTSVFRDTRRTMYGKKTQWQQLVDELIARPLPCQCSLLLTCENTEKYPVPSHLWKIRDKLELAGVPLRLENLQGVELIA